MSLDICTTEHIPTQYTIYMIHWKPCEPNLTGGIHVQHVSTKKPARLWRLFKGRSKDSIKPYTVLVSSRGWWWCLWVISRYLHLNFVPFALLPLGKNVNTQWDTWRSHFLKKTRQAYIDNLQGIWLRFLVVFSQCLVVQWFLKFQVPSSQIQETFYPNSGSKNHWINELIHPMIRCVWTDPQNARPKPPSWRAGWTERCSTRGSLMVDRVWGLPFSHLTNGEGFYLWRD